MTDAREMTIKREEVKKAFPGIKWANKVRKMPEDQVIAIYLRLKAQNKV